MKVRSICAISAVMMVAGCAKNPDAIAPMTMPINAYAGLTCEQLTEERQRSALGLTQAEADQRQAVTGDAVGVFLIGVPVSSLSGADKEGVVAQRKGEIIAIEAAQRNSSCS